MALRLEIISPQRQQLGERGSIVLGVAGGSIGRALDNDWALPDQQRYLSGHHARIHFRAGHYIVEDTSSNGVFVNEAGKPLGKRGIHRLGGGDILRMGEYRILVRIDEDDAAAAPTPPGAATMANLTVQNVVPLRPPAAQQGGNDSDLGHSLDIAALIPPDAGEVVPWSSTSTSAQGENRPSHTGRQPALSANGQMKDRVSRLRAAAKARLEGTSPSLALQNGMQAFCRGAGVDNERLPVMSDAQSLQLMGRLLREALLGLKQVLRAQAGFQDSYGIRPPKPEAPSLAELGINEYLLELLNGHEQLRLDAVMQLRDQFASAARHDGAVEPALRKALALFVGHLDPARMDGMAGDRAWARYREIYAQLLRTGDSQVPHLFVEALAQAYLDARGTEPPRG